MRHLARSSAACLLVLASLAGCSEEKKVPANAEPADSAEPGAQKKPALGGKLAAAVKAAESAQAPAAANKGTDGPPERGVFAPGAADKILAFGAAPKIELLGEGSDPKVSLAYAPSEGEMKVNAAVAFRNQGRGVPVDYALSIKIDKPKDKPKDEKKGEAPASYRVIASVTGVGLPSQLRKEDTDILGKLKGAEVKWQLSAAGGASDTSLSLPKGAEPALEQLARQLVEGLGLLTPPLPGKPVGAGAYWMVTDRVSSGGIDLVRYRVFRVEKIEKDKATLALDVRQYSAKADFDAGEGQKLAIEQFESLGKGKVEWTAQGLVPPHADAQVRLGIGGRIQTGQQAAAQTELSVKLSAVEVEKKK